jgi:protein-S-isoprenylcysteine O-methyltransferase Ste14/uncharacterized membrane protein (UPF0127 family)
MPILNLTRNLTLKHSVVVARNPLTRLTGLLGSYPPDLRRALYIIPCNAVHTFGMRYALDIAFLDGEGSVVRLITGLAPNRLTGTVPSAATALEFAPGALADGEIRTGDRLEISVDEEQHLNWEAFGVLLHWPMNLAIAAFWSVFVYSSYIAWQHTGRIYSLGFVAVNALLCLLFLTRRSSNETSHRVADWLVALGVVGFSRLFAPPPGADSLLSSLALPIQTAGFTILIVSLLSLGRSFGLVPANRGIKKRGMYRVVRHPVYAGELVLCLGLLLGNPSARSLGFVIIVAAGQVYRAFAEERILKRDNDYCAYMKKVKRRLIPGIF